MMGGPERLIVDDAQAAAVETAEFVIAAARRAVDARGRFHLCATGGSTPAALYAALRAPERAARMPWSATEIWFGDDRHVPRTSPLSNLAPVDAVLLAPGEQGDAAPIRSSQVHPWPTEENGAMAVDRYLATIRAAGIDHTPAGFPQFDLVLIGIGGEAVYKIGYAVLALAGLVWLIGGQVAAHFRREGRLGERQATAALTLLKESMSLFRLVKCFQMERFNQTRVERQLTVLRGRKMVAVPESTA